MMALMADDSFFHNKIRILIVLSGSTKDRGLCLPVGNCTVKFTTSAFPKFRRRSI